MGTKSKANLLARRSRTQAQMDPPLIEVTLRVQRRALYAALTNPLLAILIGVLVRVIQT
jgi:hypothetical protein